MSGQHEIAKRRYIQPIIGNNLSVEKNIALGLIPTLSNGTQAGRVKNVDAADNAFDVWTFADDGIVVRSDTKTFPSVAATIYLTSSSGSDTAVDVIVNYIDSTGAAATSAAITLTGQTPVTIGATGLDVNSMYVSTATVPVGIVYATITNAFTGGVPDDVTDVLAHIPIGYGKTQQAMFTVPLGKQLIIDHTLITAVLAAGGACSAEVSLRIKEFGAASLIERIWYPTDTVSVDSEQNIIVPARAQIVFRVDDVSGTNTHIACDWKYTLRDV